MKFLIDMAAIAALLWAATFIEARAAGDCIWGGATIGSRHIHSDREHNEQNLGPHAEVCLGRDDVRLVSGWDRNSRRTDSIYWGIVYAPFAAGPARIGMALVRVSGYGDAKVTEERKPDGTRTRTGEVDDEPKLAPFFVVAIERGRFGGNLLFLPKTEDNSAVLALQLKWKFR